MKKLFILLFVIAFAKVEAQYIIAGQYTANDYFHDVVPDSTYNSPWPAGTTIKPIDINGDGIIDFELGVYFSGGLGNPGGHTYIAAKNNNEIVSAGVSTCTYSATFTGTTTSLLAEAFDIADTIKNSLSWVGTINIAYRYYCEISNFSTLVSKYLGVRIFVANDTLYGWIKIGANSGRIILQEFACNKGTSIGINEYSSNSFIKLFPNPTNSKVEFVFNIPPTNIKIKIVNSLGQIFLEDKKSNSNKFSLDVSNYTNGIYFVEVESNQGISRSKFIKE